MKPPNSQFQWQFQNLPPLLIQLQSMLSTTFPPLLEATTILPSLARISARSVVKARTAIISDATVMSNWTSRVNPFSVGDWPDWMIDRYIEWSTVREISPRKSDGENEETLGQKCNRECDWWKPKLTDGNLPQISIVGVDDPLPSDSRGIDVQSRETLHFFLGQCISVPGGYAQLDEALRMKEKMRSNPE